MRFLQKRRAAKARRAQKTKPTEIIGLIILTIAVIIKLSGCSPDITLRSRDPIAFYLAGATATLEQQQATEVAIYQLEETAMSGDTVRIDLMGDKGVQNVFSSSPDKQALWGIASELPQMQSSNEAIVSAIYSIGAMAKQNPDTTVQAIIATTGTSDKAAIEQISAATMSIAELPNFRIAVVGVTPANRAPLSNGFSSLSNRVQFATSEHEIAVLFESFGG